MPVLGLPRIVSTEEDFKWILNTVASQANGITICTGSLSVNPVNDVESIIEQFIDRIQFIHLRNTHSIKDNGFYESGHIEGQVNMFEVIRLLLIEQKKRKAAGKNDYRMPMRVDHGLKMLSDYNYSYNPGYPLIGRMKGYAELSGLEHGIERVIANKK